MATQKRRENGAGTIYKRGSVWIGKYCDGLNEDGTKHYTYISAPLKADVRKKLQETHLNSIIFVAMHKNNAELSQRN